jgi:hypothetical protein
MRPRPAQQLSLTDSFLPAAPANDFLDRLDALVDWQPIRQDLEAMFTATTGRRPQPPLAVFKMLLLEHCYGLSDPQCEALVLDRLSWRKFTGLAHIKNLPTRKSADVQRSRTDISPPLFLCGAKKVVDTG